MAKQDVAKQDAAKEHVARHQSGRHPSFVMARSASDEAIQLSFRWLHGLLRCRSQ
jgi:hypothetical protein